VEDETEKMGKKQPEAKGLYQLCGPCLHFILWEGQRGVLKVLRKGISRSTLF
jgi:hypothetical protein